MKSTIKSTIKSVWNCWMEENLRDDEWGAKWARRFVRLSMILWIFGLPVVLLLNR